MELRRRGTPVEYVAVKIDGSELWSIIDAKSGEVVCKDEFKASGVMTDGEMLYLSLEDGTKEIYNINNVKTPVASKLVDVAPFNGNDVTVAVKEGKAPCIIDREGKQVAQLPNSVTQVGNFVRGWRRSAREIPCGDISTRKARWLSTPNMMPLNFSPTAWLPWALAKAMT